MNPPARRARRILVVDDEEVNRRVLELMLREMGYEAEIAEDGLTALEKARLGVDLVLLDALLPGLDGFEVARRVRADPATADLPILMLTVLEGREARVRALAAGVNDFVSRPVDSTELQLRVVSQLRLKEATDVLKRHAEDLEQTVSERTGALRRTLQEVEAAQRETREAHLDTIRRLVLAAEYKDLGTATHVRRMSEICALLAEQLGLPAQEVDLVRWASPLHDVGKIGIPDAVLLKPGPLSSAEREVMQQHTVIGARMLEGSQSNILRTGELIALTHHERWDGSGYPRGLDGERIPLCGRICAVADVLDAMTTPRPYRPAFSAAEALQRMRAERGRHFDPRLLDLLIANFETVAGLRSRLP